MISLGLTDDRRDVRQNFERLITCFDDVELIWSVSDGEAAIRRIQTFRPVPDVLLMDIEMRNVSGIEATARIRDLQPDIKIVMLTIFEDETHVFEAIRAGACGYLLKDEEPEALHKAIRDAHAGRMPMSPVIASQALRVLRETPPPSSKQPSDYGLSEREVDILGLLAEGMTYKSIAAELFISPNTVRSHIDNVYRKLQVGSKLEARNIAAKYRWF